MLDQWGLKIKHSNIKRQTLVARQNAAYIEKMLPRGNPGLESSPAWFSPAVVLCLLWWEWHHIEFNCNNCFMNIRLKRIFISYWRVWASWGFRTCQWKAFICPVLIPAIRRLAISRTWQIGRYTNEALCQTDVFHGTGDHNHMQTTCHRLMLPAITNLGSDEKSTKSCGCWRMGLLVADFWSQARCRLKTSKPRFTLLNFPCYNFRQFASRR